MENKLEKRYGLFVAICMVVGIVIGSGVFVKSQDILNYTNNDVKIGIFAWILGGIAMIGCALQFALFARRHSRVNGIIDYTEVILGPKYAYFLGSFLTYIYYPAMTSVLGWVCARFTLELFNYYDVTSLLTLGLSILYILGVYSINVLAPKLSGKVQISTTVIKLIPIVLIAVVGLIAGLINGNLNEALHIASGKGDATSIFSAICACAFAYEGWIIATSINSELKNSKRNLPLAIIIGSIIIILIYILFFIGQFGATSLGDYITSGTSDRLANVAVIELFGKFGGTLLQVFILISCIGTLNGLMVASIRARYFLAVRNQGLCSKEFSKVNEKVKMPINSSIFGLVLIIIWLLYFFFGALQGKLGIFNFDSSELPIITIYAFYIPLFIKYMIYEYKESKKISKLILPIFATICSLFMIFCAVFAHGIKPYMVSKDIPIALYLVIFALVMLIAYLENRHKFKDYKIIEE